MISCYGNYYPKKMSVTGLKVRPYSYTRNGVRYRNGDVLVNDGHGPTPAKFEATARTMNVPGCGHCVGS